MSCNGKVVTDNSLKHSSDYVAPALTLKNSAFLVFMILRIERINWLVIVMEMNCVFYEVEYEFLNIIKVDSRLEMVKLDTLTCVTSVL